jgi:hypothetical protein
VDVPDSSICGEEIQNATQVILLRNNSKHSGSGGV